MSLRNTSAEWGALSKALHWLVTIGLVVLVYLGLKQAGMDSGDEKTYIRFIHASIALVVFVLMTVRLVWRFMNEVPGHPAGVPAWQRASATLIHWGLYVAVYIQLIAGGMTVATGGNPLPFFGIFSIPLPVAEDSDAHHFWEEVHEATWIIVAVLVVMHVVAALYNHFVLRNEVLRRMTSGIKGAA